MTIGFFHGFTVKKAELRLKAIEEMIGTHHAHIEQATADRQAAIRVAEEEIARLANLKFNA